MKMGRFSDKYYKAIQIVLLFLGTIIVIFSSQIYPMFYDPLIKRCNGQCLEVPLSLAFYTLIGVIIGLSLAIAGAVNLYKNTKDVANNVNNSPRRGLNNSILIAFRLFWAILFLVGGTFFLLLYITILGRGNDLSGLTSALMGLLLSVVAIIISLFLFLWPKIKKSIKDYYKNIATPCKKDSTRLKWNYIEGGKMQFDESFLKEMGLSAMPESQKQEFLNFVQEELEVRIGERISRGLTEVQLNEFDMITDPGEAAKWLEKNRPDYREIVNRTIEEMKAEIRANRARLVGA